MVGQDKMRFSERDVENQCHSNKDRFEPSIIGKK